MLESSRNQRKAEEPGLGNTAMNAAPGFSGRNQVLPLPPAEMNE